MNNLHHFPTYINKFRTVRRRRRQNFCFRRVRWQTASCKFRNQGFQHVNQAIGTRSKQHEIIHINFWWRAQNLLTFVVDICGSAHGKVCFISLPSYEGEWRQNVKLYFDGSKPPHFKKDEQTANLPIPPPSPIIYLFKGRSKNVTLDFHVLLHFDSKGNQNECNIKLLRRQHGAFYGL